jgi:hypothetical protein
MAFPHGYICGCYYLLPPSSRWSLAPKAYLAQVSTKAHTTILSTTSRTTLTQTFVNPSEKKAIKELSYSFPLYDGVSVVAFTCRIGNRTIVGEVKEKEKARAVYTEAKERGEVAGLLEQLPEASDVFITKLGNVPPGSSVVVEITYLGELKHDAEVDGVRFTIPSHIAPRYGTYPGDVSKVLTSSVQRTANSGFEVTIDAELSEGAFIRELRSPSHPIAVSLGTTSIAKNADPSPNKASATLSLGTAELEKDFILQLVAKETSIPAALLETHPTIPGQRALMATLVPKFALPPERPEIVFICDRSGSMTGSKITALRNALKVFLKSLPVGTKFNICSFGSSYSFLWPKSASYSQASLDEAVAHVSKFDANFGGTEMYRPLEETIKRRYADMSLEIFLVTDGEIWDQQRLFDLLNKEIGEKKAPIRVFTLGIGDAFSSSLIEGVARASNGFAQAVGENEKLDGKVVRMLKAALSPHIEDYTLEIRYEDGSVEKAVDSLKVSIDGGASKPSMGARAVKKAISLFDTSADPDATPSTASDKDGQAKFAHLPAIAPPNLLQAPHKIPPLFAFSRTTVYLLLSPLAPQKSPTTVVLRATSRHGPLELEIPVQILSQPGQTIHQLAAKKAVHELEEGRGWLSAAIDASSGKTLKEKHEGRFSDFVEREAVRLGVTFGVVGKFCSFVAVQKRDTDREGDVAMEEDWDFLDGEVEKMNLEQKEGEESDGDMGFALSVSTVSISSITKGRKRKKGNTRTGSGSAKRSRTKSAPSKSAPSKSAPSKSAPSKSAPTKGTRSRAAAPESDEDYDSNMHDRHSTNTRSRKGGRGGGGVMRMARQASNSMNQVASGTGSFLSFGGTRPPLPQDSSMLTKVNSLTRNKAAAPQMQMAPAPAPAYGAPPPNVLFKRSAASAAPGGAAPPALFGAAPPPPPAPRSFGTMNSGGGGLFGAAPAAAPVTNSFFESAKHGPEESVASYAAPLPDEDDEEEEEDSWSTPERRRSAINKVLERGYELPSRDKSESKKKSAKSSPIAASLTSIHRFAPARPTAPPADTLQTLLDLQTFEGYWDLTDKLSSIFGVAKKKIEAEAKKAGVEGKILATVLAVQFLMAKLEKEKESWELVAEKAKAWLEGEGVSEGSVAWAAANNISGEW